MAQETGVCRVETCGEELLSDPLSNCRRPFCVFQITNILSKDAENVVRRLAPVQMALL